MDFSVCWCIYIWRLHLLQNFTSRLKPEILFDLGTVHILFWNFQTLLFLPLRITSNEKRFLLAQGLFI